LKYGLVQQSCGHHDGLLAYEKVTLGQKGDRPRIRHNGLLWAMPESQAVEKKNLRNAGKNISSS
jgi:hypothetical protein